GAADQVTLDLAAFEADQLAPGQERQPSPHPEAPVTPHDSPSRRQSPDGVPSAGGTGRGPWPTATAPWPRGGRRSTPPPPTKTPPGPGAPGWCGRTGGCGPG